MKWERLHKSATGTYKRKGNIQKPKEKNRDSELIRQLYYSSNNNITAKTALCTMPSLYEFIFFLYPQNIQSSEVGIIINHNFQRRMLGLKMLAR